MITLCVFVLFTGTLVTAQNPGLKVVLSETGLNYATNMAIDQLMAGINGMQIPDQSGRSSGVDYSVTSMSVTRLDRPTVNIDLVANVGVTGSVQNLGASVHGNWRYSKKVWFVTVRDSGSFDVSVQGVSATVSVDIGVDSTGLPTATYRSCRASVGRVDVDFHGGWSWLYNLFSGFVERPIKNELQGQICKTAQATITDRLPGELASLKVRIPIHNLVELDYRLVSTPAFSNNQFETSYKGEFFWIGQNREAPFQPQVMPYSAASGKMVTLLLSDYVTNTLGFVIYHYGTQFTSYTLTKDDLPEDSRHFVEISGDQVLPDGLLQLHMLLTEAPRLQTTSGGITGILAGQIGFKVKETNGNLFDALTVNMKLNVKISVGISGGKVIGSVAGIEITKNVTGAAADAIPPEGLDMLLTVAINSFIIPHLNAFGAMGFEIPTTNGVSFVSPAISLNQGYIAISTDLEYTFSG